MGFRLAAIGDLHCSVESTGSFRYSFEDLNVLADALVLCGDLTRRGKMSEIEVVVENLAEVRIPTMAVLGNHDYHEKNHHRFREFLNDAGVTVLDGDTVEIEINGHTAGLTGTKGFAGGFGLRSLPDFGEEIWRLFYQGMQAEAEKVRLGLRSLTSDLKIAVLHYSPVVETLTGEDPQVYPFLGSSALAEAIDDGAADLAIHSHAHFGQQFGMTPGGVPVRNVSEPLLEKAYRLFDLPWPSPGGV
jgi:Icc-related predicted phosphoesterase